MKNQMSQLSLKINLNPNFLRLVTSFVEESAKAFGLSTAEALKLTLACEEIFTYLCHAGRADEAVIVEAANGGYYTQIKFLFKGRDFNPRAFNLTAGVSLDDKASLEEMGLLIASRSVDRFFIAGSPQQELSLVLIKEKSYPEPTDLEFPEIKPIKNVSFRTPDPETLKLFVRLVVAHYSSRLYLPSFCFPGKVADMIASGEYSATVALGNHGQIGGGIMWRWLGNKTVELFGPYLFNQLDDSELANGLVDSCLGRIAKTDAIGLISRYSTPELPKEYFEPLGSVDLIQSDGTAQLWPIYYRQLYEDLGCRVWVHPNLQGFLRTEYDRLSFAREILLTRNEGEGRSPYSVFAVQFERTHHQVTLQAIWDGDDASENLAQHIKVLKAENLPNIFFEIDLAQAWQANLIPALLENNFEPRLILPYGGQADVVVLQHQGAKR
jgi:anti-sigma regulatory factor (Ser/Thr protein kinase)